MVVAAPAVDTEIAEAVLEVLDGPWTPAFGGVLVSTVRQSIVRRVGNAGINLDFHSSVLSALGESIHISATLHCRTLIYEADRRGAQELPFFVFGETIAGIFDWQNDAALKALGGWASSPAQFAQLWGRSPPPNPAKGWRLEWVDTKSAKRSFADGVGKSIASGGRVSVRGAVTVGARDFTVDSREHGYAVIWSYPYFMSPQRFGATLSRPVTSVLEDGTYCFGGQRGEIEVWDKVQHLVSSDHTRTVVSAF